MGYSAAKFFRTLLESIIHAIQPEAVLDGKQFPWAAKVEELFPAIQREARLVLGEIEKIVNFAEVLPNQRALKQGHDWKSYFLVALHDPVVKHQARCPVTMKALHRIPGVINAFFSILAPGAHITAHRGPYAGILRYHLGLIIPEGDVAIRVDKRVCRWKEGASLFFDDSFDHEAWNRTESVRIILFVDMERPLPPILRGLNRFMLLLFRQSQAAQEAYRKIMDTQILNN